MPREPRIRHVLREARAVIDPPMSQERLAEMIGVEPLTINRLENKSGKVSQSVLVKIMVAIGLSLEELRKGEKGKLLDVVGRPYTAKSYQWWRSRGMKVEEGQGRAAGKRIGWWAGILLAAAERDLGGRKYYAVWQTLIDAIQEAAKAFKLQKSCARLVSEAATEQRVEDSGWRPGYLTPADLRHIADVYEREMNEQAINQGERDRRMTEIIREGTRKRMGLPDWAPEILTEQTLDRIGDERGLATLADELMRLAGIVRDFSQKSPKAGAPRPLPKRKAKP